MSTVTEQEQKYVHNVYSKIASHFNNTRAYTWDWIESFIDNHKNDNLLYDIGCGSGRNLRKNIIGLDMCDEFINICKQKGHQAIKGDITNIPFENETADALLCIAVFHHLTTNKRRIHALNELNRIMKPNCELLFSVWSIKQPVKTRRTFHYGANIVPWNQFGKIYNRYYYIFTIEELETLFCKTGFCIVRHIWNCGNEVFILKKLKSNI